MSDYDENIQSLELRLLSHSLHDAFTTPDAPSQLEELRAQHNRIAQAIACKKTALGIEARDLLNNISRSNYLWLRMNARALKQHLRDRLRQRKFELERLERAYRVTVNGRSVLIRPQTLTDIFDQRGICEHTPIQRRNAVSQELLS